MKKVTGIEIWGKSIQGENSKGKGPGAGIFLTHLRNSQEASVKGTDSTKRSMGEDEV